MGINSMTQARLIICPQSSSDAPVQVSVIKQLLTDMGLLANEFEHNSYYAGEHFISLVIFLGCSPNIQLSPEDGDAFCYIKMSDVSSHGQHLGHCQSVIPKCPNCKSKITDWKNTDNWQAASSEITCNDCNTRSDLADLKWRQQGGYGRFSISIANIHPHEAVPAEKIFQNLKNMTGFEWTYFYANNETEL